MANTLEQEMYNCFMQLSEEEKKSLLQMLKTFLKNRKENAGHISIEQYNKELEGAEAEFERGEYITHEELLKQLEQWKKSSTG